MKNKYFKNILLVPIFTLWGSLVVFQGIFAQELGSTIQGNLDRASGGLQNPGLPSMVAVIVKGALGLLVIIFFIMIIAAGFKWMTAGGNEETVKSAKANIKNAIIGTVIVIMAYAITAFIFEVLDIS